MKLVKHCGVEYSVPDWVNYLATDGDGDVYGFEDEPYIGSLMWMPVGEGHVYKVAQHSEMDWTRKLTKV